MENLYVKAHSETSVSEQYAEYAKYITIVARVALDMKAKLVSELWVDNGRDCLAVTASLTCFEHSLLFVRFQPSP